MCIRDRYSTDSVKNSLYSSENAKLKNISLDYVTKEIFDATDSVIAGSDIDSTIFAYPSIPIFYWLYDKKPTVHSIVQWFDVMPSGDLNGVIADLKSEPPKYIFWLKPPGFVYQGHLMMKKSQLPMNVIDDYIYSQIDDDNYKVIKSIPIIHGNQSKNSDDFRRYLSDPISYQFICKSCNNKNLNDMLAHGNIVSYAKNMDYNNNNYIDIKFKNKYEASIFISKFNLFPINQNDWIFYILERK
jgi:hypothetical protein